MAKINLHIHSNYSDGFHSVKRILKEADKLGFEYIAITDHNEIKGSLKAIEKTKTHRVKVIPGLNYFFYIGIRLRNCWFILRNRMNS